MRWLGALLAVGYPFLVVAGLQRIDARWVALALLAALGVRSLLGRGPRPLLVPGALVALALGVPLVTNGERGLLLAPAAMNGALLVAFGRTLFGGPSLVETIARQTVPELPEDEVRYCRSVTLVWCLFFVANGALCAWLAFYGERGTWAWYTGFVAYLLMGALYAVELTIRARRFGRSGSFAELLLPPRRQPEVTEPTALVSPTHEA